MKGPKLEWFEIILANVTQQFKKLQIRLFKIANISNGQHYMSTNM